MLVPVAPLFAEESGSLFMTFRYWEGMASSILYTLIGIGLMLLAIKVFDWISPKIDVQVELTDKKNTAVAIVVAAIILGVSYLVGIAIH